MITSFAPDHLLHISRLSSSAIRLSHALHRIILAIVIQYVSFVNFGASYYLFLSAVLLSLVPSYDTNVFDIVHYSCIHICEYIIIVFL